MNKNHLIALVLLGACMQPALGQDAKPATPVEESPAPAEVAPAGDSRVREGVAGPAPGRRTVPRVAPAPVQPFKMGSFLLYPELVVTGMYDDNVYSTHDDKVSDHALIVTPSLWAQSAWERHFVSFHASADFTRYRDQTDENTNDYRFGGEGRYDVSGDTNVYGGLRYGHEHEDRESPDDRNGTEPTRYKLTRGYGGSFWQLGDWSVRVGANALKLNFDDVPFVNSAGVSRIINNDDRDRDQYSAGVRVGYEIRPRLLAFGQISGDWRRYDSARDDLGFKRDSDGLRAVLGVRTYESGSYKLEAFAGAIRQNYKDAQLADVSRPTAGANLVWNVGTATTFGFILDRSIEETTSVGCGHAGGAASSYVNSYGQANLNHSFTPSFSMYAFGSLSRADYRGINREDDYVSAGVGALYRVARSFYIDVTYQNRRLNSSIPTEDFRRNQLFLRLAFPFSS
jgi:hypothetical protein